MVMTTLQIIDEIEHALLSHTTNPRAAELIGELRARLSSESQPDRSYYLGMSQEEFDKMPKPLTIYNSLYHVPQMRPDYTDPPVWVWTGKKWRECDFRSREYPHNPEPSRIWSYDDPTNVTIKDRTDFAYLEIKDGERIYHALTDENRLKMPGYMREKTRFEHKVTHRLIEDNREGEIISEMSAKGWELSSVLFDNAMKMYTYYWKRPK